MWDWKIGGVVLGLLFFLAVALMKPIGVSTQFVILDGIIWDMIDDSVVTVTPAGYSSSNSYLAKSGGKYAKNIANPLNYSFLFVLASVGGAALSAFLRGWVPREERKMPPIWQANFGASPIKRYMAAFAGGFIVLYGARLAGGCTSGHMMSGMMQTSLSGYIFAAGAFASAVILARILYRKEA